MTLLTALWLLSSLSPPPEAPPVTLFDDLVEVAPGQARSLSVPAQKRPARILCAFRVLQGGEVRLLLLPAESVDAWIDGKPHEELAATGFGRAGALAFLAAAPRELVLMVQGRNGSKRPASLKLLVRLLDPAAPFPPAPQPPDRRRGDALVWGSMALFAAVASAGAVRLRRLFAARR